MLEPICQLAREAGAAIMTIYRGEQPMHLAQKQDNSPVTAADLAAHEVIKTGLSALTPMIPILSEEDPLPWEVRRNWTRYWLVDPLDGTKEFLQRNGEFTVNIALIEDGKAVMGVVYAPAMECLYYARTGEAWKEKGGQRRRISVHRAEPLTAVVSRSHADKTLQEYLHQLGDPETMSVGSSLKFCLVAEGTAQLYPRFNPTHIWDTAAGQAIAEAAGAHVADWQGNALLYTPKASFINPGFRVFLL